MGKRILQRKPIPQKSTLKTTQKPDDNPAGNKLAADLVTRFSNVLFAINEQGGFGIEDEQDGVISEAVEILRNNLTSRALAFDFSFELFEKNLKRISELLTELERRRAVAQNAPDVLTCYARLEDEAGGVSHMDMVNELDDILTAAFPEPIEVTTERAGGATND